MATSTTWDVVPVNEVPFSKWRWACQFQDKGNSLLSIRLSFAHRLPSMMSEKRNGRRLHGIHPENLVQNQWLGAVAMLSD